MPETENREDLSLFKLQTWCVDPDEVPADKHLWVQEPEMNGRKHECPPPGHCWSTKPSYTLGECEIMRAQSTGCDHLVQMTADKVVCRRTPEAIPVRECGEFCHGQEVSVITVVGLRLVVRPVTHTGMHFLGALGHQIGGSRRWPLARRRQHVRSGAVPW